METIQVGAGALAEFVLEYKWFILSAVLYLITSFVGYLVVEKLFGWESADKFVRTYGIGLYWIVKLIYAMCKGMQYPMQYRRHRLFRETFDIDPKWVEYREFEIKQKKVDTRLRSLASAMQTRFDEETQCYQTENLTRLDEVRRSVAWAKSQFWNAHALADKCGYMVKKSYRDYLNLAYM